MIILVDYNLNQEAILFAGILASRGWLDLVSIRLITFADVGLPANSNDRAVRQFAQANRLILLTANRNAKGQDSLERVMREENTSTSFPIITIGDRSRVSEYDYRDSCVEKLVEIVLDIQDYMGSGRLFIP